MSSLPPRLDYPRKPRLLHVFPTFDPGGAQTRFVALANRFGGKLHHLIVAMDGRTGCAGSLGRNVDFQCLDLPVTKNTIAGNLPAFRRVLRLHKPDLLVTHNWGTIEWAMAKWGTGVRHIHIEDGFGPDEALGQHSRRVLTRRIVLRNSTVVVPSRTLERLARETWHIPRQNLHYIPNGIDVARFARATRADPPQPELGPVIGTVSALRREKNLSRLLRVFAGTASRVPCRLTIVGDGPERDALTALAADLRIADRVRFTGHMADPAAAYRDFDIFALTSDTEQMPYTMLEAMAAQCPVVATDVGDIASMVAPENRPFIVPCHDEALIEALLRLVSDPPLRQEIGLANLTKVRTDFIQEKMLRAFADLFEMPELIAA